MSVSYGSVVSWLLLGVHLAAAVYWDVRERRVPNKLVISGLVAALFIHLLDSGLSGLWMFLAGAVTGLVVLLPMNLMRLMGAGDVKLMAMAGAFAGSATAVLWMVLYTFIAGGLLVVVFATLGRAWGRLGSNLFIMWKLGFSELDARGAGDETRLQTAARLPYAVAIACGSLAYLLFGAP